MFYYGFYEKFLKWCENHTALGILIILGAIVLMLTLMRLFISTSYDEKIKKTTDKSIKMYKGVKSCIMKCLNIKSIK